MALKTLLYKMYSMTHITISNYANSHKPLFDVSVTQEKANYYNL